MSSPIDHLVFATPDLQKGIEQIEEILSVIPVPGGSHPGLGTCNAHVSLGPLCYLEIIGPDPSQVDFQGIRPFGIDDLEDACLMAWAARRNDLSGFVQRANAKGANLSELIPMSRVTAEGATLEWKLSFPTDSKQEQVNVVPFFIDWGDTPHPSLHGKKGVQLLDLELQHPDQEGIAHMANILELEVTVALAAQPRIVAQIQCPSGKVVLS